jgi:hypothetical protein
MSTDHKVISSLISNWSYQVTETTMKYGLIDAIVEFEDWYEGDVTHVMVGPATFHADFGPWKKGEKVDCLLLDYSRGFLEELNDEGEVARKVEVKLTIDTETRVKPEDNDD